MPRHETSPKQLARPGLLVALSLLAVWPAWADDVCTQNGVTLPGCNWVTTPGLTGTHLTDGWAVYCPQQEPYHWTGYYAKIVDGASSSTFSVGEHYGSEDVLGKGDYYWTQWLGDGTLYIQSGCSVVSQDGNCTNTDGVCHPDPGCSVNDRIQNCMGSNCWYEWAELCTNNNNAQYWCSQAQGDTCCYSCPAG